MCRRSGCVRGLSVALKNEGNSPWSCEPTIHGDWGNPNLYLDQPITKGWCQPMGGHASHPTDSPIATMLGMCSSLYHDDVIKWKHFLRYWPFVPRWIPTQRPAARSCDVFFDKRLCKQSWGWLFETLSRPLWRQCNDYCSCCSGKMHPLQVPLPGFPSVYWSVLGSRHMGWWRYKHMLSRIQAHIRNTWRCILYLNTSHIITQRMQNNLKMKKW